MTFHSPRYTAPIFGALCGDAIGAHVEFQRAPVAPSKVKAAMAMNGGGTHRTAAGQITDDGEQALGLLRCLSSGSYRMGDVLAEYKAWLKSNPFDLGGTTSRALSIPKISYFKHVEKCKAVNSKSEANGALMRLSPLVAYCLKYETIQNAVNLAKIDTQMTHPNPNCVLASQFYMALAIMVDADRFHTYKVHCVKEALSVVTHIASLNGTPSDTLSQIVNEALESPELPKCDGWDQGYWGVALKCTIWALLHAEDYDSGIAAIIAQGGDTDTNACIAGGILALYKPVPEWRVERLFDCDTTTGRERPAQWQTRGNLKLYLDKLFAC